MMIGSKGACRNAGVFGFVIAGRVKSDGVGAGRLAGYLAQYAGNRRAVGTAAQKGANALILADRVADAVFQ
ncbi:MAG: hypothetical protein P8076_16225 [Gammaproteobacteria bacterium]